VEHGNHKIEHEFVDGMICYPINIGLFDKNNANYLCLNEIPIISCVLLVVLESKTFAYKPPKLREYPQETCIFISICSCLHL